MYIYLSGSKGMAARKHGMVCYTLEAPDVRQRELRAITESAAHLKAARSCVITFNSEETNSLDGLVVDVVPAWKWLLADDVH